VQPRRGNSTRRGFFLIMNLQIEPAMPDSIPEIVRLMRDFAAYENLSEYCTVTEEALSDAMFGRDAFVKGIIARDERQMVAYALFYRSFSTFRGQRGYFLEDLYIDTNHRGTGMGTSMLKAVARTASADGADRLDFLVLNWNEPAIRFYKSHGAVCADDELHFKFTDDAFARLAR
jgi:ribosomal protein S18 acetylase RimI-like enzyme